VEENEVITHIIARNPPLILWTIGGIEYLLGISGAGILLIARILLQVGWLARFFI